MKKLPPRGPVIDSEPRYLDIEAAKQPVPTENGKPESLYADEDPKDCIDWRKFLGDGSDVDLDDPYIGHAIAMQKKEWIL